MHYCSMDKKGEFGILDDLKYSRKEIQGKRPEMEDETLSSKLDLDGHYIFCVFDGHGGAEVVKYLKDNIIDTLLNSINWKLYKETYDKENIKLALEETFLLIDENLNKLNIMFCTGSTANVCIITPSDIICANVGDSRAILISEGSQVDLSTDNKPENEIEFKRIIDVGAFIQDNRIGGILAPSRGFGDFMFKKVIEYRSNLDTTEYDNPKKFVLTVFPDVTITKRESNNKYLILACDGIWDVCTSEKLRLLIEKFDEIVESLDIFPKYFFNGTYFVSTHSNDKSRDKLEEMSEYLLDVMLREGTKDNCSIILVKLN